MKTLFKFAFSSLAIVVCLSLGNLVLANADMAQSGLQKTNPPIEANTKVTFGRLAWQRVGSPISQNV